MEGHIGFVCVCVCCMDVALSLKFKTSCKFLEVCPISFYISMLTSFGKLTELTGKHSWVDPSAWALIQTRTLPWRCGRAGVYKCSRKSPLHGDEAINRRCLL